MLIIFMLQRLIFVIHVTYSASYNSLLFTSQLVTFLITLFFSTFHREPGPFTILNYSSCSSSFSDPALVNHYSYKLSLLGSLKNRYGVDCQVLTCIVLRDEELSDKRNPGANGPGTLLCLGPVLQPFYPGRPYQLLAPSLT